MANSYSLTTGTGSQVIFPLSGIDGWVSTAFLKVYLNDVLQTTGFSFVNMTTTPAVQFGTAPGNGVLVRLQRETARVSGDLTIGSFQSNIIDFNDGSVLTAGDLDKAVQGLVHVAQESNDSGSGALGLNIAQTAWTAANKKITNVSDGTLAQDAVTLNQFNLATLFGGSTMQPELWTLVGSGTDTYTLTPAPSGINEDLFFVTLNGVVQPPSAYNITPTTIVFTSNVTAGVAISIRNLGVARSIVSSVQTAMIVDGNVTTAKLNDSSVTTAKLATDSVTTAKITDANVTYAKIQNVTPNKLLGRVTAGSGVVEEVTCTPLAQTFLTKTTAADQRTALELQPLAIKTTVGTTDIDNSSVTFAKMQGVGANVVLGTTTAGTIGTLPNTTFGLSLLNTASATTAKSTLGITPTVEVRNFTTTSGSLINHIEINLSNAGTYGEINKEFVIVCNFTTTTSSTPTTAGQDLYFSNIDSGAVWRVSYNLLKVQNTASSQVPKPQVSTTVFETIFRGASNSASFPISGAITLLPVAHVTDEPTETQVYTGDGTDNTFEVCGSLGSGTNSVDVDDYLVTLNNVVQPPSTYTINSTNKTLSFTAGAPAAGVNILIRTIKSYRSNTFTVNSNYTYTNIITVERLG